MNLNKFIEDNKVKNANLGEFTLKTVDLNISEIKEISYKIYILSPLWGSQFRVVTKDGQSGRILRIFPWNYKPIADEITKINPGVLDKGFGIDWW